MLILRMNESMLITHINVPCRTYMEAEELADALRNCDLSSGQIFLFFTETHVDDQLKFAEAHGVSHDELMKTAKSLEQNTGYELQICSGVDIEDGSVHPEN